tara:strand:- start:113 stop:319 length:207 start_codon:yes stop_codon:yes gene_type:complete
MQELTILVQVATSSPRLPETPVVDSLAVSLVSLAHSESQISFNKTIKRQTQNCEGVEKEYSRKKNFCG